MFETVISNPWFYAAAIPAVLIAGISKGGFGAGLGVLGVPLMALVVSPVQAAAVMLPILCTMDIVGIWAYWRKWDARTLILLGCAATVGIGIGALTFHAMQPWMIRLMVGVIALGFAGDFWIKRWRGRVQATGRPHWTSGAFWGAVSGFTSFTAHAGGPPVNVYLLRAGLAKTTYQATTIAFFTLVNYVKLGPYFALDLFSGENVTTSLILLPLAVVAMRAGVWLHHKVPQELFFKACYAFLIVTGGKLVFDGLRGAGAI